MNLYLISQSANDGYDTYDSAVVAAPDEISARHMHPTLTFDIVWKNNRWEWVENGLEYRSTTWTHPDNVEVELIGVSTSETQRVICSSFNAG